MRNKKRLERLKHLHCMLKNHDKFFNEQECAGEKVEFNLSVWKAEKGSVFHTRQGIKTACGTVACALGSAALYPPFMKEGLGIAKTSYRATPVYNDKTGFDAGAEFFGIDLRESTYLFAPSRYKKDEPNSKDVARRVKILIKRYEEKEKT